MNLSNVDNNLFWRSKSIEQLAKEQEVRPAQFEKLMGGGRELWETSEDFEQFVAEIHDRRHELSHA